MCDGNGGGGGECSGFSCGDCSSCDGGTAGAGDSITCWDERNEVVGSITGMNCTWVGTKGLRRNH